MTNNGIFHDSARKSLTGEAQYIDDLNLEKNAYHGYIGVSTISIYKILFSTLTDISSKKSDLYKFFVIILISSSVIFLLRYLFVMFVI